MADYFRDERNWGLLESIKKAHPDCTIKVMASTHNTVLEEFLSNHPYIDEFQNFGWRVDGYEVWNKFKGNFTYIKDMNLSPYYFKCPELHLKPEEVVRSEEIQAGGRYVVIHPFGLRSAMPLEEWPYLVDGLVDRGYRVVVIGGTHVRLANETCDKTVTGLTHKEEWNYERVGVVNTVNQEPIRVVLDVLSNAAGFIGGASCFNMFAWINEVKSVIYSPPYERQLLSTHRRYAWPLIDRLPWCRNYYADEWQSPRWALDQTLEFFG